MTFRRSCLVALALIFAVPGGARAAKSFELLSRSLIEGPSRAVAFFDGGAILGTGGGILVISGGDRLREPSFLPVEGEPREILVVGRVAYVSAFNGGLIAVDISDPLHPRETFHHEISQAMSCAHARGTLFLVDFRNNLHIYGLENPREPRYRESRMLPRPAVSISAEGDMLCIALQQSALLHRVMPGGVPDKVSELKIPGDVKKTLIRNGILFILTADGTLMCWDISKADRPAPIKPIRTKEIVDFAIEGSRGLLLTKSEFLVPFEIRRGGIFSGGNGRISFKTGRSFSVSAIRPAEGSSLRGTGNSAAFETETGAGIALGGERFAVFAPFDGMRLCSFHGRSARLLSVIPTRGVALDLIASRGILYVANAGDGVRLGRVGADGSVQWIGHIQTTEARDIALTGNTLVIADGSGGLKIADVRDPRNPKIIARHASPFFMSAVVVRENRAYCAGGLGGVEVVDFSEPPSPKLIWRHDFSEVRGIGVDERHLYFADGYEGFRIYALGDRAPSPLSLLDTPGWNCDVFIERNTAYLADGGSGIAVVDIGDRRRPRVVGELSLGTLTREIHLFGKTLFAAGHTKGVFAVDVSNPRNPSITATHHSVDDARGVFADEKFVYLASASGGVYIFRYQ